MALSPVTNIQFTTPHLRDIINGNTYYAVQGTCGIYLNWNSSEQQNHYVRIKATLSTTTNVVQELNLTLAKGLSDARLTFDKSFSIDRFGGAATNIVTIAVDIQLMGVPVGLGNSSIVTAQTSFDVASGDLSNPSSVPVDAPLSLGEISIDDGARKIVLPEILTGLIVLWPTTVGYYNSGANRYSRKPYENYFGYGDGNGVGVVYYRSLNGGLVGQTPFTIDELRGRYLDLPPGLAQGTIYTAVVYVPTRTTRRTYLWNGSQYTYNLGESVVSAADARKSLTFEAPAPPAELVAEDYTITVVKNTAIQFRLRASRNNLQVVYTLISGAPAGFRIAGAPYPTVAAEPWFYGTPSTVGVYNITYRVTEDDVFDDGRVTLTVVDALPKTTISSGVAIEKSGVVVKAGESMRLEFLSSPSSATWRAVGLPAGLQIDGAGVISGISRQPGNYFVTVVAQGESKPVTINEPYVVGYGESDPFTFKLTVNIGSVSLTDGSAAARVPWLLTQWQLTDVQIIARTREVQSTMFNSGSLNLKLGDAVDFAIFFVDAFDSVFAMEPDQLRLTIRKTDNLDDSVLVFEVGAPPSDVTEDGQTYYVLSATTGDQQREMALEWIEESGKNDPLPCVADVDWTVGGKVYSSKTFPVTLDLDVTRP
jgi:hypothetical protein